MIKPQLGILIPILIAVLIKRYAFDPARPDGRRLPWLLTPAVQLGSIRLISSGLLALATAAILWAPFGLSIVDLLVQVGKTAGGYPYITVNAYNPWALPRVVCNGLAKTGIWLPDIANRRRPGPGHAPGGPGCLVGTALSWRWSAWSARGGWRDDRRTILVGLTILAIAFFVVPTRVHERYLFPFFALGAILAATSFRWRLAYLALALANFANLYAVLTTPFYNNPGISDWLGVGDAIRSQAGVTIAALTHLAVGLWALTELRRGAQVRLDAEIRRGRPVIVWPTIRNIEGHGRTITRMDGRRTRFRRPGDRRGGPGAGSVRAGLTLGPDLGAGSPVASVYPCCRPLGPTLGLPVGVSTRRTGGNGLLATLGLRVACSTAGPGWPIDRAACGASAAAGSTSSTS